MIDAGTMVSLLVGNHEIPSARGVTLAASRTLRAIYRHAVLTESNPLQSEGNFHAQLVRRRSTAKKNLRGTPVNSLRRDVQRRHFIALGQLVPAGACRKQRADVIFLAETSGQRQHRKPLVSNIIAERFRGQQRQKILITAGWQNGVRISATR